MTISAKGKRVGTDLTEGPIYKGLIFFVLPIVLTNLIQQIYSMVDLMVVGQFVGSTGTSGVSVGGEIADFLTPFATAFATAGQIYIAQLAGARKEKELKEAIGSFLAFMILISICLSVIVITFSSPLLNLLNCPSESFSQARNYMIITALGYPFIFGYNAVCGLLRGMGESKRPLIFISCAAVSNIVMDLLLVIAFKLEAAGTAIATIASQFASFSAAFAYMYKRREDFDFELKLSYFKIRKEPTKVILALGLPQAARSLFVHSSMLWSNARVNSFGLVASSTNGIGNKLLKFLEIFSSSTSQASAAMVGQNLGAKKYDRAKWVVRYACITCLGISAVIALIVFLFPHALFGIFTNDADVLDLGTQYLHIMIIHFFASAVTSSYQSMVLGSGHASLNFVIGILDGVVCKVGISLILEYFFSLGVYSYFLGTATSRIIPGIICILYFRSGAWKKRKLIK